MASVEGLVTWWRNIQADPRRADLVDMAAMVVAGTVLVALGIVDLWSSSSGGPIESARWWHLVPLSVAAPLVLIRRSQPVLALIGGLGCAAADAVLGGSLGVLIIMWDLIFSAARHGSGRTVRWLVRGAVGIVVGAAVAAGWATGDARAAVFAGLQVFGFFGVSVWWGVNVRQEAALARTAQEVADLERQRAADLARLAELREKEAVRADRARMARDLHDVIASHVSAIAIHAEAALARPPDIDADRAALGTMRRAGVTALTEMRAMIALLRSADGAADTEPVAAPPRLSQVGDLVRASRSTGLDICADVDIDTLGDVAAVTEQAAYRILQEALTNAAKYAAGPVEVGLRRVGHDVEVAVRSVGSRPTSPSRGGMGLVSMRERAEALGGTFAAGWEGDRFAVHALLPVTGSAS